MSDRHLMAVSLTLVHLEATAAHGMEGFFILFSGVLKLRSACRRTAHFRGLNNLLRGRCQFSD
jgi:hypothetical protein